MTIAVEHAGAAAARRFVAAAAATFPTVVDEHGLLSRTFGFKAIPNGLLVDEGGTIRWAKFGGFSIDNADDVDVVERFLRGEAVGPSPAVDPPYALGPVEREFVAAKLLLGQSLLESGQTSAAAATWREALHLDPQNFTIRKQIWVLEHPDKFHPVIDFDWQGEQLAAEQAREVAAGICGLDGCPMPRRATTATIAPSPVAD